VRAAKARGVRVTCEVTPHHLTLTDEAVAFGLNGADELLYDTNAKVNPPLRSRAEVEACVAALVDGTIDCIATDHAPHAVVEKLCEFDAGAFGISGLETAFGLCMKLVHSGAIDIASLIERLTTGPARTLELERSVPGIAALTEGAPADVVVLDPEHEWVVEPERFASKGKNTPLAGSRLRGFVVATIAGGKLVHESREVAVG
jgi:dihydroorotase